MREAEKLMPCQTIVFSPPTLISRPAPSPRSSQATRLTISKPLTVSVGCTAFHTQLTSALLLAICDAQACQLPIGRVEGETVSGVLNAPAADHGPAYPCDSARTRHVYLLSGLTVLVVVPVAPDPTPESSLT